jgi:hypothetical protein
MSWKGFVVVFVLLIGTGFGIAYMERGKSINVYPEDCAAYCKPKQGSLERVGPNVGPDWRPTSHNIVCVCR